MSSDLMPPSFLRERSFMHLLLTELMQARAIDASQSLISLRKVLLDAKEAIKISLVAARGPGASYSHKCTTLGSSGLDSRLKRLKLLNAWRAMTDAVLGRTRLKALPVNIHLEVNDCCNLHCFMCPREGEEVPRNTGNISLDIVHKVGPLMKHTLQVGLVGNGEPFLHPKLFEINDYIVSQGSAPSIITNGTLLKSKQIDKLVGDNPLLLLFSIDGATKETFEHIRGGANFEKVVAGLMALAEKKRELKAPQPIVGFVVTLMKENLAELSGIVQLGAQAGASTIVVQNLLPHLDRLSDSVIEDRGLMRNTIEEARQLALAHSIELRYLEMGQSPIIEELNKKADSGDNESHGGARFYCANIWQQLHIQQNGDAQVCCFWKQGAHGNLNDTSTEELWNDKAMRETRLALLNGELPVDCRTCHVLERYDRRLLLRRGLAKLNEIRKQ